MKTDGDLKSRLASHIEKTGYPLEIQIASLLEDNGWDITSNHYFVDPDTRKSREIDIRAFYDESPNLAPILFDMFVECKRSSDYSLVFFPRTPFNSTDIEGQIGDINWVLRGTRSGRNLPKGYMSLFEDNLHYSRSESLGNNHTLTKPGAGAKPDMFEAMTLLTKAQALRIEEELKDSSPGNPPIVSFTFLTVVFDGPMFDATVTGRHVQLHDSSHSIIRSTYGNPNSPLWSNRWKKYLIDVVKPEYFTSYLRLLSEDAKNIQQEAARTDEIVKYLGMIPSTSNPTEASQ